MAMIKSFRIKDFGCIQEICVDSLSNLNVVVGPNSAGKSTLLRLLYATIKSAEMFKRGKDDKSYQVLLGEKLRWVFQVDSLAELVRVGKGNCAELEVETLYETVKMRLTPEKGLRLDDRRILRLERSTLSLFRQKRLFRFNRSSTRPVLLTRLLGLMKLIPICVLQ